MKHARIENGVITKIRECASFFDVFTRLSFKFFLHKRIDQLDPMPQVGWHYDKNTGFTEN